MEDKTGPRDPPIVERIEGIDRSGKTFSGTKVTLTIPDDRPIVERCSKCGYREGDTVRLEVASARLCDDCYPIWWNDTRNVRR